MLLLIDGSTLLDSLPIDSSPSLVRLVKVSSPFKSLQTLASDADISLGQVILINNNNNNNRSNNINNNKYTENA